MPKALKKISASELDYYTTTISSSSFIKSNIDMEDYVSVYGLIAFLQNYINTVELTNLGNPLEFGLKNTKVMVTIEISY
jgi:hypothetical protein